MLRVKTKKNGFNIWNEYDSTVHKIENVDMHDITFGKINRAKDRNCRTFEVVHSNNSIEEIDIKCEFDLSMVRHSHLIPERINKDLFKTEKDDMNSFKEGPEKIKSEIWMDVHKLDEIDVTQLHQEDDIKNEDDESLEITCVSAANEEIPREDYQDLPRSSEMTSLSNNHYNAYNMIANEDGGHIFNCGTCSFQTYAKEMLSAHVCAQVNSDDIQNSSISITENSSNESSYFTPISVHPNRYYSCIYCNTTVRSKKAIDEHLLRKHPDCIASVTSKIHECKVCSYKTAIKSKYDSHMLKHSEEKSWHKFATCMHCEASFRTKALRDNHIIKEHPEYVSSVTSKLYQCKVCKYKTVFKPAFDSHVFNHPEEYSTYGLITCIHCKTAFRTKTLRDEHILNEHPGCIELVTSKIHECNVCNFQTTVKAKFNSHMLKHPEQSSSCSFSSCIHCKATFQTNRYLGEHIMTEHPEYIESITSKIHTCEMCDYRTTFKSRLNAHLLRHTKRRRSFESDQ